MITTDLHKAVETLNKNELVAIPTETVYGLAANANDDEALRKIYALKNRPFYNPLILHISSLKKLATIAAEIPAAALKLAEAFWPGPLTLVLKKQPGISNVVTSGSIPNLPIKLTLFLKFFMLYILKFELIHYRLLQCQIDNAKIAA